MFNRKSASAAALAVALGVTLIAVPIASAGNLDDGFIKGGGAAKIRDYLQERGYKNVGVLRFEVKKGKAPASMNVSKMNSLVATRLENALIHVNDPARPLGVTRGAGAVAAKAEKNANWHTAAGRKKLFDNNYPLAWGSKSVRVDAFLTGTVEVSPDFAKTKIIVKVFDKENLALRVVGTPITVDTDRDALREMGLGFVLAKRALKIIGRDGEIDQAELDQQAVTAQQGGGDMGVGAGSKVEQIKEFMDFQLLVDNAPAAILPDGEHGMINTPAPGQQFAIKVTAKEKLGLLLTVNGVNILNKERDSRDRMESSWWVMEPAKEYTLTGFYKDGKVEKFSFAAETEVDLSELGDKQDKHGVISFEIFRAGGGGGGGGGMGSAEPKIIPRKTTNLLKVTGRSTTLNSLQKSIGTSLHKLGKRNVYLVGRGGTEDAALEGEAFEGIFIAGCDIRYRPR